MANPSEPEPNLVDDPDLEAALDEAEAQPGELADEVFVTLDAMLRSIAKAVA